MWGGAGEERGRKLIFHSWNALRAGVSSNNARNAATGRTLKITSQYYKEPKAEIHKDKKRLIRRSQVNKLLS